jgi:hypothetical protein
MMNEATAVITFVPLTISHTTPLPDAPSLVVP